MDLNTREISTSDLIRVIMQIEHTNQSSYLKNLTVLYKMSANA